jgi:hypothetical protein
MYIVSSHQEIECRDGSRKIDRVAKHFHYVEYLQLANRTGFVDFSIGYINEQICGYEMRDANCTGITAYIVRLRLPSGRLALRAVGLHQTGEEFPRIPISGDSLRV